MVIYEDIVCSSFDSALIRLRLKCHFYRRHNAIVCFWFKEDHLQYNSGEMIVTI